MTVTAGVLSLALARETWPRRALNNASPRSINRPAKARSSTTPAFHSACFAMTIACLTMTIACLALTMRGLRADAAPPNPGCAQPSACFTPTKREFPDDDLRALPGRSSQIRVLRMDASPASIDLIYRKDR